MAWLVLLVSAIFEAIWATALGMSDGLSRPVPTLVFFGASLVSLIGLGWAVKFIPIGTGYAVWTGVGAALTVGYAILSGTEPVSVAKMIFICGIIGAVIGLKLVPAEAGVRSAAINEPAPPQRRPR